MSCPCLFLVSCLACTLSLAASTTNAPPVDLIVVIGAAGEKEFEPDFVESADHWVKACQTTQRHYRIIDSRSGSTNQLDEFKSVLASQPPSERELWIVLIGHGTFDGKDAKFNMAGPDLSAADAAQMLASIQRPIIFINTSAASAPFLPALSRTNRMIVTASKSGYEENYARFGKYLGSTIGDASADIDKDGQVSLLEAFLIASRRTEEFYATEKRLATEHALLDDNGDAKGTPASFFRGIRPAKQAEDNTALDGFRAHQLHFLPNADEAALSPVQRRRRNEIEVQVEALRAKKKDLPESDYLNSLEPLLIELSRLYESIPQAGPK